MTVDGRREQQTDRAARYGRPCWVCASLVFNRSTGTPDCAAIQTASLKPATAAANFRGAVHILFSAACYRCVLITHVVAIL
ncbi:MAG TPA: hypothetical protein VIE40_05120, partial [Dehalococcoidia bacterium]